jgi:Tfp pilus assembly protein PilF
LKKAEQPIGDALKIDPDNWDVRLTLALLYLEKKDHPRAVRLLETLVQEVPRMHDCVSSGLRL